jgi:hypothetical protein
VAKISLAERTLTHSSGCRSTISTSGETVVEFSLEVFTLSLNAMIDGSIVLVNLNGPSMLLYQMYLLSG